jgi:hypothetical protein
MELARRLAFQHLEDCSMLNSSRITISDSYVDGKAARRHKTGMMRAVVQAQNKHQVKSLLR